METSSQPHGTTNKNCTQKDINVCIKNHYNRPLVKDTLIKAAEYKSNSRIAIFDLKKFYILKPSGKNHKLFYNKETRPESEVKLFQGNESENYSHFIKTLDRVYYLTLNYLPQTHHRFHEYYLYGEEPRQRLDGFDEVSAYMLSVDIDLVEPHDIDNEEDQEMLMKAVQHVYEKFNEISKSHVLVLFSGGGAYLQLHPAFGVVDPSIKGEARIKKYNDIIDSFNNMIVELERTFENKYPEYGPYKDLNGDDKKRIKFDRINNINRQIKAPMSLHRTKTYAVLPIKPGEWKIPLKNFWELTDEELSEYKDIIFDFIDNEPTNKDLKFLRIH